jgi:hypothetical protein
MKPFRKALRYWFAFASLFSFLGGWIILAHSPKPVLVTKVNSNASYSNLPPIQAFGQDANNNGLGFFSSNSQSNTQLSSGFPVLRTGGS